MSEFEEFEEKRFNFIQEKVLKKFEFLRKNDKKQHERSSAALCCAGVCRCSCGLQPQQLAGRDSQRDCSSWRHAADLHRTRCPAPAHVTCANFECFSFLLIEANSSIC